MNADMLAHVLRRLKDVEGHVRVLRHSLDGEVVSVEERLVQTELVGDQAAGASVVVVADARQVGESGQVSIGGDVYAFTVASSADLEDDDEDTLSLTPATVAAYSDGTPVLLEPERPYRVALVSLLDVDADPVEVHVPHHWRGLLDVGPRQAGLGEQVQLRRRHGRRQWQVADVYSRRPKYVLPELVVTSSVSLADGAVMRLASTAAIKDSSDSTLVGGNDSGTIPSGYADLQTRMTTAEGDIDTLETEVAGLMAGSGGSFIGGVAIDCGGAAASGVEIDCGGA